MLASCCGPNICCSPRFNQNNAQKGKINEEMAKHIATLLDLGYIKNLHAEEEMEHTSRRPTHTSEIFLYCVCYLEHANVDVCGLIFENTHAHLL